MSRIRFSNKFWPPGKLTDLSQFFCKKKRLQNWKLQIWWHSEGIPALWFSKFDVVQCKKCQGLGHIRSYCTFPPVCIKCGGGHDDKEECTKPKDVKPKRGLWIGEHSANNKGCPKYQEAVKSRIDKKAPGTLATRIFLCNPQRLRIPVLQDQLQKEPLNRPFLLLSYQQVPLNTPQPQTSQIISNSYLSTW